MTALIACRFATTANCRACRPPACRPDDVPARRLRGSPRLPPALMFCSLHQPKLIGHYMKTGIATLLALLPMLACAEQVFIQPSVPVKPGQIVEAEAVRAVLYPDRQCVLPIAGAMHMHHAIVSTSGLSEARCWSSPLGNSITTISASGNQSTYLKSTFVPARTSSSLRFEVLGVQEQSPLDSPSL